MWKIDTKLNFFSEFEGPLMKVAKQIFLNFIPSRKDQQHPLRKRISNGKKNPGCRGEPPGRADRAQVWGQPRGDPLLRGRGRRADLPLHLALRPQRSPLNRGRVPVFLRRRGSLLLRGGLSSDSDSLVSRAASRARGYHNQGRDHTQVRAQTGPRE